MWLKKWFQKKDKETAEMPVRYNFIVEKDVLIVPDALCFHAYMESNVPGFADACLEIMKRLSACRNTAVWIKTWDMSDEGYGKKKHPRISFAERYYTRCFSAEREQSLFFDGYAELISFCVGVDEPLLKEFMFGKVGDVYICENRIRVFKEAPAQCKSFEEAKAWMEQQSCEFEMQYTVCEDTLNISLYSDCVTEQEVVRVIQSVCTNMGKTVEIHLTRP